MRFSRGEAAALVLVLFVAVLGYSSSSRNRSTEVPIYLGRSLEYWRRHDFFKFREGALALGTNAVPYLVSELSATDSAIRRVPQRLLERCISAGEVFTTAKGRRFDASCALISLGTNAIPALLATAFANSTPLQEEIVWECAKILARSTNSEAIAIKTPPLLRALRSGNDEQCRTAIVILSQGDPPPAEISNTISLFVPNSNPRVGEVAKLFFQRWPINRP